MRISLLLPAAMLLSSLGARAGQKSTMHCFAWTPIKEATPADWDAFYKTSDELPKMIKGISKVWYGKLQSPLGQIGVAKIEPDNLTKLRAGQTVPAEVTRTPREYGMCMEFKSTEALKAYDADPFHKIWTAAYSKVRVEGTTTINILGQ